MAQEFFGDIGDEITGLPIWALVVAGAGGLTITTCCCICVCVRSRCPALTAPNCFSSFFNRAEQQEGVSSTASTTLSTSAEAEMTAPPTLRLSKIDRQSLTSLENPSLTKDQIRAGETFKGTEEPAETTGFEREYDQKNQDPKLGTPTRTPKLEVISETSRPSHLEPGSSVSTTPSPQPLSPPPDSDDSSTSPTPSSPRPP